ncbi:MFS transporter [Thermofilum pendens]|uniref:Major facilitator superfamily MFS_1 n=1 Tax=Thermofilum pendens (strain DSM 2475 / Hrk 5) TaxID=368408 RepID=A1S0R8_THEPD|nr:MFS transporter [Thermofilum pendens]ABL79048.1 major facilitator superfamily MFS_1 [Thermofilum pendens Hrk 5]
MPEKDGKPGIRNVYALGFVSLFTDVSTEMINGYLPVFLVQELGATRALLGLIEGIGELANYFFRLVSGYISDRLGRRKALVFAGYSLSAVSKPLFAFAHSPWDALVVKALDRTGKGIRTSPRDALISQSIDEESSGKAFGLHRTIDQSGAMIGPLLATLLLPLIGPRNLFLVSFIPAVIALAILLAFVVDVKTESREARILKGARQVLGNKRLLLVLAAFAVMGLGYYDFSFLLVRSREVGVAADLVPLVYLAINLFHTAVGYPSGVLSDRVGKEKVLVGSLVFFALASIALARTENLAGFAVAVVLYGVFFGSYETVSRAILPRFAPPELRGTVYGVFYIATGLATLAGMTVVGYLWDTAGRAVAFTYSATLSLIAALLFAYSTRIS